MTFISHKERLRSEIAHGKKIAEKAQKVWNWEGVIGKARYERRVRYLSTALRPGTTALELGCGTGLFSQEFDRSGAQITAIDLSPDLLAQARLRALKHVDFIEGDACNTGLRAASFDVIVGSSILHHLDITASLQECFRLLKPGGSLWFTEPNYLNPHIFLERKVPWLKERMGISDYETAIVRWSLKKSLENSGFCEIEIHPFDFLYPFLPENYLHLLQKAECIAEALPLVREIAGSVQIKAVKKNI